MTIIAFPGTQKPSGRLALRNLRYRANLTIEEAANHFGITPEVLRRIEAGQRPLPPIQNREQWTRWYKRQIRDLARVKP